MHFCPGFILENYKITTSSISEPKIKDFLIRKHSIK